MKVILLRDVARLGRKGEIKDVPDGHASNFLIPKGLALPATAEHVKRQGEITRKDGERRAEGLETFRSALSVLKDKHITITVEANDKGHLFRGLHKEDIVKACKEERIVLDAAQVVLPHPIKELGLHRVALRHDGFEGYCTVSVIKK